MRRFSWRLVVITGFCGLGLSAAAQDNSPAPEALLKPQPTPLGVSVGVSTPSAAELPQCKVEFQNGPRGGAWVLKDPQGRLLRKFAFVNGSKAPNEHSYYRDGFEVYRETISAGKQQPDRFVWLGLGGMKVGVDLNGDRRVDVWQAISVEELSQEVVRAVANKDWSAYEPLLITDAELAELGAPARETARIKEIQKTAQKRFQQATEKLAHLNASTKWLHLETSSPSRMLAESTGMKGDVLMHYRALVLCDTAGKTDAIQLGEIVQIGERWKLLDAPLTADSAQGSVFASTQTQEAPKDANPALTKLLEQLATLDKSAPTGASAAGVNKAVVDYHLKRADLIRQIYGHAADKEKEAWYRQMADSYSAASQASGPNDKSVQEKLNELAAHAAKAQPGSAIAAFVTYRALSADYARQSIGVAKVETMDALQKQYLSQLEKFVAAYPTAEETADALIEMGMMLDFQRKGADAKKWYGLCARNFAASKQGQKAAGALKRLGAVGQPWEPPAGAAALAGDGATLRGKPFVVCYWSASLTGPADFGRLKDLLAKKEVAAKGVQLLAVNVDATRGEAENFLRQNKPVGVHLHAGGGIDGPATQSYGLFILPSFFVVGADGKILAHAVDLGSLEAEILEAK